MSLVYDILKSMYETELNYKGVRVNGFGIPLFLIKNKKTFKSTLQYLKTNGYIQKKDNVWNITEKGRGKIKKADSLKTFNSPFSTRDKRNLLLMFDIPEEEKVKREWLRMHLKEFNYKMIQRSVWLGPSPLPNKFIEYLKSINLYKYLKAYKFEHEIKL